MKYLTSLISEWMPEDSKSVAVDSHPRLSGIMDTVNSTLAHGPQTRLPQSFYDPRGREILDKIALEEWFAGYKESREFREVGIGSLLGDIVARMIGNIERSSEKLPFGNEGNKLAADREREREVKFTMNGCHDSTLAAILTSLGSFGQEKWPPFTSHLAIELFKEVKKESSGEDRGRESIADNPANEQNLSRHRPKLGEIQNRSQASEKIGRRPVDQLTQREKEKLKGTYVRLRYNDRPVVIPGCRLPGNHFPGDESFCTLVKAPDFFSPASQTKFRTGGFQVNCRQIYSAILERILRFESWEACFPSRKGTCGFLTGRRVCGTWIFSALEAA